MTLTPLQHYVTKENGTEPPFNNPYWDHKGEGLYVDVISGEVLFASLHKFDSGTGWPSFTQPVDPKTIVEKTDTTRWLLLTGRITFTVERSDSSNTFIPFEDIPTLGISLLK